LLAGLVLDPRKNARITKGIIKENLKRFATMQHNAGYAVVVKETMTLGPQTMLCQQTPTAFYCQHIAHAIAVEETE